MPTGAWADEAAICQEELHLLAAKQLPTVLATESYSITEMYASQPYTETATQKPDPQEEENSIF